MSYNGTVTCSHCYHQGHNKSGCPDLKKAFEVYKQKLAKYKKENPDCPDYVIGSIPWAIRRKMDLTWEQVEAAEVFLRKERKNKNRQCTYCYEGGHNRRTCKHLNRHLDLLVKAQVAYNEKIAKSLTAAGYGVGALVQQRGERWDSKQGVYVDYNDIGVVTGFNLNYCIIEFLRSKYQYQPTIHVHIGGEPSRLMPHFNDEVKKRLAIGRGWSSSPNHILLSRSHTPVPPAAHTEKRIRKYIKEDLKEFNFTSVKAWFHRLEGIVEVPNEDR